MEMNTENKKNETVPHFMLVPLLSLGHMIPMVDMAHLIAQRGVLVSFITTPINAARMKPIIDYAKTTDLPIRFVELDFNCKELGLPDGSECFDLLTSMEHQNSFMTGLSVLQKPLEIYLENSKPKPTCIISDNVQWWTMNIAKKLNIPRLVFHATSCFFSLCLYNISKHKIYKGLSNENQPVEVPDLPHKITVIKAQTPEWFDIPGFEEFRKNVIKSEEIADGVVANSFRDLEPEYVELYEKTIGMRVWPIGPCFMYDKDVKNKASRGRKTTVNEADILSWLDSKGSKSVILVTFGSQAQSSSLQTIEIGCGLESSGKNFIWLLKEREKTTEVVNWMSSGFEERTKGRGLVVTGWAPQLAILSHPAVGGLMTHCGWNSTLEAISAGVPMITCPHFADQFLNETQVVEVLKIGISLGVKSTCFYLEDDKPRVGREDVKNAIIKLMDVGKEMEEMRKRAQKYGEFAKMAIKEGGSSFETLTSLIQFATLQGSA